MPAIFCVILNGCLKVLGIHIQRSSLNFLFFARRLLLILLKCSYACWISINRSWAARFFDSSLTLSGWFSLDNALHAVVISACEAVGEIPSTYRCCKLYAFSVLLIKIFLLFTIITLYAFCSPSTSNESTICFHVSNHPLCCANCHVSFNVDFKSVHHGDPRKLCIASDTGTSSPSVSVIFPLK